MKSNRRRIHTLATGLTIILVIPASYPSGDNVRNAEWPLTLFHVASRVWPHSRGDGVLVAVLDSGVRATHQDLTGQLIPGRDFSVGGRGWIDHDSMGHGSAMASLIAAHGHGPGNHEGISGLAPGAHIMPLAIDLGSTAEISKEEATAINYAVDHGARVINMSFSGPSREPKEIDAVTYAESHDVVLVASCGNGGSRNVEWPAAYPGVVSVGAVDVNGNVWPQSNYGPQLTLTAPGVNIVAAGANSDTEYRLSDGTSDAAAYVSAEAALVRAAFPKLTAGQVVNRMVKSAVNPTGKVHDDHYGYGIIRPDAALTFDIPAGPATGPLPQLAGGTAAPAAGAAAAAGDGQVAAGARPQGGGSWGRVAVAAVVGVGAVGMGGWWWRRRRARDAG
ncbi:type VII secretion-associated serine protease mycosin [Streptacidiphilus sp. MAP12-20]